MLELRLELELGLEVELGLELELGLGGSGLELGLEGVEFGTGVRKGWV